MNAAMSQPDIVPPYSVLASGYDLVMAHVDYEGWAEYVLGLLRRHAPHAHDVLELGCGTGSFALALMSLADYRYLATDRSERMLQVARAKAELEGAGIQFAKAEFTDFRVDRAVEVILLLYDGINYLLTSEDVSRLLGNAHAALSPGGIFLFDVSTPYNSETNAPYFEDRGRDDAFSYVRTSRYEPERKLHVTRLEMTVEGSRAVEEHVQRAYAAEEIGALLEASDWQQVHSYDGFSTAPATPQSERIHWVLKKA